MKVIKWVPSYKKTLLNANFFTHSNPKILFKRQLYVKEQNLTIKNGIARIPVVNLSDKSILLSVGSIISDYEIPAVCAGAFSNPDSDLILNSAIVNITQKDKLAYLIYYHIKDSAKNISKSVLTAWNRICKVRGCMERLSEKYLQTLSKDIDFPEYAIITNVIWYTLRIMMTVALVIQMMTLK